MRYLATLLFVFSLFSVLGAQSYYVAIIKGEVSYKGKLLKKRDKIKPKGKLVFSTQRDYIKVSGPGGIHKITPEESRRGGTEFFTALREELFPAVRMRESFAYGTFEAFEPAPYHFYLSDDVNYFDSTRIQAGNRLPDTSMVAYVYQAYPEGLRTFYVPLDTGNLILTKRLFDSVVVRRDTGMYPEKPAALVAVNDTAVWQQVVRQAADLSDLHLDDFSTNPEPPGSLDVPIFETEEEQLNWDRYQQSRKKKIRKATANWAFPNDTDSTYVGTILNYFDPNKMIDKGAFIDDMFFQVKVMKPTGRTQLLEDFYFDEYIKEVYGSPAPYPEYQAILDRAIESSGSD